MWKWERGGRKEGGVRVQKWGWRGMQAVVRGDKERARLVDWCLPREMGEGWQEGGGQWKEEGCCRGRREGWTGRRGAMGRCYGTFCRPCTICRWRQIVPTLAAHFVAPLHNLTPGDKMCCSGRYVWGRQNVPCKSAYFVVPHWMDLNIQWYLFAKYKRSNVIHLMVCIYYIYYISALALICVVLTMLW